MVANLLAIGVLQAIHARGRVRGRLGAVVRTSVAAGQAGAVLGILKELRAAAGARRAARRLGRARAGCRCCAASSPGAASRSAVREQGPVEGAAALVHVLAGRARARRTRSCSSEAARRADPDGRGRAPGRAPSARSVRARRRTSSGSGPAAGFPVDGSRGGSRAALGEEATPLAARLPVLRRPVCEELIRKFSRQNALVGVGRLRARRRPAGADAQPAAARAPDRRRLRVRDRPGAAAGGARRGRLRARLPGASPAGRSGTCRSSAGR